jgi:hypothetical protein
MADLPMDDSELAFVIYERSLRRRTRDATNEHDNYAEREYANKLIAFIELEGLDIPTNGGPPFDDRKFWDWYHRFVLTVDRFTAKISVARLRGIGPEVVTAVYLSDDYKSQLHDLLGRMRKVVNATPLADDKKDAIYRLMAKLQAEIDTSMTRVAAFYSRMNDLTAAVGEWAENLEPAVKIIERIKKCFGSAMEDSKQGKLPPPEETKRLPPPPDDLDDEIPF